MIKAVIFDMGGVLLQTIDRSPRKALAERYGLSYAEIDALVFDSPSANQAELGEIREEEHWQAVCQQLKLDPRQASAFRDGFWGGDRLNEELMDFIRGLRKTYRIGLLSNAWSGARQMFGEQYHGLDSFDVVVYSAEIGLVKPAVQIYQYILKKLDCEPGQAIFVDDNVNNVQAARALGIHGVHYRNNQQAEKEILEIIRQSEKLA